MVSVLRWIKQYPIPSFILAAFGISWAAWIPMAALGIDFNTQAGWWLYLIGSFGPSLAGLLLARTLYGAAGMWELFSSLWRKPLRVAWLITAIGLPFVVMGAALSMQAILGGTRPDFSDPARLGSLLVVAFIRITFIGGPLGEELGWRGFALPRLQARRSALRASLLLGLVWGLWHAPIYFIPGTGQYEMAQQGQFLFSFASFLVWTLALSILLTWLYNNTAGNLLVVLLFHSAVNTAASLPLLLNAPGMAMMLNGAFTWLAALVVILVMGGDKLSRSPITPDTEPDLAISNL
jgi:uncharacterized protein